MQGTSFLSKKYQKALLNRELKPDFFIEMDAKALKKIEDNLPDLYREYGKEGLIDLFVDLNKKGKIANVTDFRLLQKVLQAEKYGVDSKTVNVLARRVIVDQDMSFQEANEIIKGLIDITNIEQKALRLRESVDSIDLHGLKEEERFRLRTALVDLRKSINRILRTL